MALDPAELSAFVAEVTGARAISRTETVQRLWSGYGEIVRCHLDGGRHASVIVKHVRWPDQAEHPRGWATDHSHERKVRSYRVEVEWYEHHAARCAVESRVPVGLAGEVNDGGVVLVLEDLDVAGFSERRQSVDDRELHACVSWLADFHAEFLGAAPDGLWPTGTYWHLATRPDELDAMPAGPLKEAAAEIDGRLAASAFQTIVHGDAKLANFCFDPSGERVAAVDFQYVGRGCGMKDLAYFISSCFDEGQCEHRSPEILDRYFELLTEALARRSRSVDVAALETDWRELYPFAWTDFSRFLQGWSPGHWKLHGYSARLEAQTLAELGRQGRA